MHPPAPPAPDESAWIHGTILVIDDEPPVREVLAALLEDGGFRVLQAADGRSGLAEFECHAALVRAVLLDLSLPGVSAKAVLDGMRALVPDVPVLLVSGRPADELRAQAREWSCAGQLQKPFGHEVLFETLRGVLAPSS
jgi:DNA-binding response OmpR family regulator